MDAMVDIDSYVIPYTPVITIGPTVGSSLVFWTDIAGGHTSLVSCSVKNTSGAAVYLLFSVDNAGTVPATNLPNNYVVANGATAFLYFPRGVNPTGEDVSYVRHYGLYVTALTGLITFNNSTMPPTPVIPVAAASGITISGTIL